MFKQTAQIFSLCPTSCTVFTYVLLVPAVAERLWISTNVIWGISKRWRRLRHFVTNLIISGLIWKCMQNSDGSISHSSVLKQVKRYQTLLSGNIIRRWRSAAVSVFDWPAIGSSIDRSAQGQWKKNITHKWKRSHIGIWKSAEKWCHRGDSSVISPQARRTWCSVRIEIFLTQVSGSKYFILLL